MSEFNQARQVGAMGRKAGQNSTFYLYFFESKDGTDKVDAEALTQDIDKVKEYIKKNEPDSDDKDSELGKLVDAKKAVSRKDGKGFWTAIAPIATKVQSVCEKIGVAVLAKVIAEHLEELKNLSLFHE